MKSILFPVVDFIFPPKCLICGNFAVDHTPSFICLPCCSGIEYINSIICPKCGHPFISQAGKDHFCGDCLANRKYFSRARSIGYYRGILQEAIHQFKYNGKTPLSSLLGDLLANCPLTSIDYRKYNLLIPVPLHKKRLKERGFNQALLLALQIKKKWGIPFEYSSLMRSRWTEPQTGLNKNERLINIRGAFQVTRQEKIQGKKILLVDDVYTTGFTINECSETLIKFGAENVDALTLARTV